VREHLEAAKRGDAAAQFYLYRALSECGIAVSHFGEYPGSDELAAGLSPELDPRVHQLMARQVERCRGFFDDDPGNYGNAQDWLLEAARGGHAPAVVLEGMQDYRLALAGRDSGFSETAMITALRSRNPEALAYASQFAAMYGGSEADESAWLMLACDHGQDCSPDSDWVQALCIQEGCPPSFEGAEDALSILLSPGEMEMARDRVAELEAALDRGDFEALFGGEGGR
jgi:TPR repeat protein